MSVQILLQGRITGADEFALSSEPAEDVFCGRLHWVTLLSEVLPRALIGELELSKMLLGSSGGGQFLLVLPGEVREQAEEFLAAARSDMRRISAGSVDLLWAITENLGDWTVVRKRLNEEMAHRRGTPLAGLGLVDRRPEPTEPNDDYFASRMCRQLRAAKTIGWSPEAPGLIEVDGGKHSWPLGALLEAIPFAQHTALTDDGEEAASAPVLAQRSTGSPIWGLLRGDVDTFGVRLRRLQSIEEYVQLSMLYKQFFAGEVEVLCSLPEFWRKVNLLHTGGNDFAIYGAWDALIGFARELERVFVRFTEDQLKDFPGADGKTISMALALAPETDAKLSSVYQRAGDRLRVAKSTDKDCFYLLGRTLEWKQLGDAAGLKDELTAMVDDFGIAPSYIRDLCGIYRETRRGPRSRRVERPWRFHRRMNRILGVSRARDFQRARASLIAELAGKNPANLKLRPSGRVALEWARLATEREEAAN